MTCYLVCQAALALAKRGENIDRLFIGISPGGVGQSLYTANLAAMLGPRAYTHVLSCRSRPHVIMRDSIPMNSTVIRLSTHCCLYLHSDATPGTDHTSITVDMQTRGLTCSLAQRVRPRHNHAYFDPNVWMDENEMRKQVGHDISLATRCNAKGTRRGGSGLHTAKLPGMPS